MEFIMINELWPGGPRFKDADGVFKLSTDSVLLAHFIKTSRVKRVIDLGCGSGVISVLLALRDPELFIDGVEINPAAARLATENAELCGISSRMTVTEVDLRRHRELFPSGAYDLAVSNPPYYALGHGKAATRDGLAPARGEDCCSLSDICSAASYLTRWGGSFALVHKPERLAEVFNALSAAGFEPKRMRFVQHKPSSPPSLALIESRRGGKPSLTVEAPLILTNCDGSDTDEVKAIYHR